VTLQLRARSGGSAKTIASIVSENEATIEALEATLARLAG
jgi:hypothetical protein